MMITFRESGVNNVYYCKLIGRKTPVVQLDPAFYVQSLFVSLHVISNLNSV